MPCTCDDLRGANHLLPPLLQVLCRFSGTLFWNVTVLETLPQLQGEKVCILTFERVRIPLGMNMSIGREYHSLNDQLTVEYGFTQMSVANLAYLIPRVDNILTSHSTV